jgi:hypothetical protein
VGERTAPAGEHLVCRVLSVGGLSGELEELRHGPDVSPRDGGTGGDERGDERRVTRVGLAFWFGSRFDVGSSRFDFELLPDALTVGKS